MKTWSITYAASTQGKTLKYSSRTEFLSKVCTLWSWASTCRGFNATRSLKVLPLA